jgi:hypothetical protein
VNGGGTINAGTGLFTAGNTAGTYNNTVRAAQGGVAGTAGAVVTAVTPGLSEFAVLANAAVACTDGSIIGRVGTFRAGGEVPPGSITLTGCPVTGTTHVGDGQAKAAFADFLTSYTALENAQCGTVLTGTLAGQSLAPGVYCFDAGATLTGTLTLNGPSNGVWLFKTGTSGVGALTGTNFTVVMAGGAQACNVSWLSRNATTMTDSNLRGNVFSGADVTLTRGTMTGNAWAKGDATITETAVTGCS